VDDAETTITAGFRAKGIENCIKMMMMRMTTIIVTLVEM
jgi:hypothetical protein